MCCDARAVQVDNPDNAFELDLCKQGKYLLSYWLCYKNINIGKHSDVYEMIWFKLGMMIDKALLKSTFWYQVKLQWC